MSHTAESPYCTVTQQYDQPGFRCRVVSTEWPVGFQIILLTFFMGCGLQQVRHDTAAGAAVEQHGPRLGSYSAG